MTQLEAVPWWDDHRNIAMVQRFMAAQGGSIEDLIYAAEKPWKHNDDYNLAIAELSLPPDLQQP